MRNKVVWTALAVFFSAGMATAHADEHETVLIKRDAVEITKQEYRLLTRSILDEDQREQLFTNQESMNELLLDYLITRTLAHEAEELGLEQGPEAQFRRKYSTQRQLAQARLQHYVEEASERDYEALAREFYIAERDNFKVPETVSVEHVLVAINDERTADEAQARIKEVEAKLAAGEEFATLATEYSDDPSAARNKGKLGFFGRGQMVKPFEEAAFAMTEPGETAIVRTSFGYHLVRYIDRRDDRVRPFEEVKEQLVDQQRQRHMNELRNEKISEIRGSDNIVVDFEAVSAFFTEGQQSLEKAGE